MTAETWPDFARLFSARGSPHHCWCSPYRFPGARDMDSAQKQAAIHGLVDGGTPIGVLAYRGGAPVGWCSIAPRGSYARLERSRTMPRMTQRPVWTVLCFFVPRAHRGSGIARALLRGAVAYARAGGAEIVEAYPWDSAGITATHRGHSSLFAAEGFRQEGTRWVRELRSRARVTSASAS